MKHFEKYFLAAWLGIGLLGASSAGAQRMTNGTSNRPPTITTMGSGETQAKPDVATVMVGVVSQGKSAQETGQINANQVQQVVDALRKAGIAEKDLQTSGYSVQPVYKNNNFAEGIDHYQVSNNVRAIVRKLADAGRILDVALTAGANSIQGIGFELEKREKAEDESLKEAVKDARRKADVIARAAGLKIVRVREISSAPREPRPMVETFARSMAVSTPVQPGELTITAQVTAVFEVAPAGSGSKEAK